MPVERILYRPVEAAEALGVSRARMYELLASGEIPSVKVGNVKRVPVASLNDWLQRRLAESGDRARGQER